MPRATHQDAIKHFVDCVERVRVWMASNHLKLNEEKTQVIWLARDSNWTRFAAVVDAEFRATVVAKTTKSIILTVAYFWCHMLNCQHSAFVTALSYAIQGTLCMPTAQTVVDTFELVIIFGFKFTYIILSYLLTIFINYKIFICFC